jgi:hypothetical protein
VPDRFGFLLCAVFVPAARSVGKRFCTLLDRIVQSLKAVF